MEITDVRSGMQKAIIIKEVTEDDFKIITKKRFSFTWKTFKKTTIIYTLQIDGEEDILGLMGLIDLPEEKRIEIKLLACSLENIGKEKRYDGIAGCLIAFACRQAVSKYQDHACISLIPKTILTKHYMKKYYMQSAGRQLYLEGNSLLKILREYI
ncbi:hypothetical protein [Flavihumibacter sp. ZG627]|uniref:hypothetical protein n=1 Tax=Flavihumibacter sp. ZG627 TaxID=1463156 RepID=UPI00057D9C82|nr:hypothetical protein [Flavihumibacter sp. ZG627]KIC92293.1 hypothetical protein HY58_01740 [Flavihumibacter sp. ZG627]